LAVHSANAGLVVHVVQAVLVVHSDQVGLVVHVVHAVLVVQSAKAGLAVHVVQAPPWLNVPLKQPEILEQLNTPELNVPLSSLNYMNN
jgi:hypothetical protein